MASRAVGLLILLNVLFFAMVSSTNVECPPTPKTPTIHKPSIPSKPSSKPAAAKCPIDTLKLGVCANLLGGLVNIVVGSAKPPCCTLIQGLADLDAAVCLCTAIKAASVLGNHIDIPVSLSLIFNNCRHKEIPSGFQCA